MKQYILPVLALVAVGCLIGLILGLILSVIIWKAIIITFASIIIYMSINAAIQGITYLLIKKSYGAGDATKKV